MTKHNFENEKIFIQFLKKGEQSSYSHLYELYYSDLCSYAKGLCGGNDLAQDIVQQTFIKFWKNKHKIDIKYSLKKYLYKCVYNQFIDSNRKLNKELKYLNKLQQEAILEIIEIPKEDIEKKYEILELEINKLPVKCKNVFLLGKKEGYKYKEIAIKLNISVKTVESHMTSALKKLKANIKNNSKLILLFISGFQANS
jgi:RNA polymerase sigma-70 factor (ECF subfamily)